MKKFYFLMCLTALLGLLTVSCKKDNGGNEGGSKLAAPVITEDNIEILSTTSAKVKWEAVPNADSYTFMVGADFVYSEKGATEITLEKLKLGTNDIKVKSVAAVGSGYEDSDFVSFTINIESTYAPTYDEYIGTWEIVPTRYLIYDLYSENPAAPSFENNADPITVYVEPTDPLETTSGDQVEAYVVWGLTQYDGDEDPSTINSVNIASYNWMDNDYDDDGNVVKEYKQLEVISGFQLSEPDADGYYLTTYPMCAFDGDMSTIQFLGGQAPAITFTLLDDQGNAQFKHLTGDLQNGGTFEVLAFEHFMSDGQYISGWPYEYYYAGPFTGRRTSTEVPNGAAFRNFNTKQLSKEQVVRNVESALVSAKPSVLVNRIIVK